MPIPAGKKDTLPLETCSMDFITDLPPSGPYNSIMVVADHDLTKGVILCACTKTIDAMGTSKLLHDLVYKHFGLPS